MSWCGSQRGVSLIETVIAILVGSLVLAVTLSFFTSQTSSYSTHQSITKMQQEVRLGLDILLRDLRMAGYGLTPATNASVIAAGPSELAFSMDLNGDNDTLDSGETVFYELCDAYGEGFSRLCRSVDGINYEHVVQDVESLQFEYTLKNGSSTSTPANPQDVIKVRATLTAGADFRNIADNQIRRQSWTVSGETFLRNVALRDK